MSLRWLALWCLVPLSKLLQLYLCSGFYWGENGALGDSHRPVGSHLQTLSHNVISSTPHHKGVRAHNFSGDSH